MAELYSSSRTRSARRDSSTVNKQTFLWNIAPEARLRTSGSIVFFTTSWPYTRATRFRVCWYRAIASGFPRYVGNVIFILMVINKVAAVSMLCSLCVMFHIVLISLFSAKFVFAHGDESVVNESDCGCGEVNNTWYVLKIVPAS